MSSALTRGAAREGELLLPGLLRRGHCGRKFDVHYGGKLSRYNCYGAHEPRTERCISVSGLSIDAAIAKEVLSVLMPLAMRSPTPVDSTMLLIQPIGSSPASWSAERDFAGGCQD